MIEYIKGKLVNKKPTSTVIETGGIGFFVQITLSVYEKLPQLNEETKIIVHFYAKENPMSFVLYGFADEGEREVFRQIISVSGIGPKTAMSILSAISYRELTELIAKGNYIPLTKISGVGKKTAERLAVELKDKLAKTEAGFDASMLSIDTSTNIGKISGIISALINLGYNRFEADKMVKKFAMMPDFMQMPVEEIIKEILRGER
jgi:Holliday junction DNA helicase RuvA